MRITTAALRPWRSSIRARIVIACAGLFLVLGGLLTGVVYTQVGRIALISANAHGIVIRPGHPQISVLLDAAKRRGFLDFSLAGLGLGTLLAGGLGWAVSRRVLQPLTAVTTAAQAATQENLDRRLALAGPPDELKELADTFDAMLTRLEAAFASQRRFVANASHELRTPLTEMRTLIDVSGDRVLLERLVSNLIDNAVKHNVTGGWVTASTRTDAGAVELTVASSGEPIPADQVTGLFEPFRRLACRTGTRPGAGLGLSIVASVAAAHGGHAHAQARPDGGLDVQITLPTTAKKLRSTVQ